MIGEPHVARTPGCRTVLQAAPVADVLREPAPQGGSRRYCQRPTHSLRCRRKSASRSVTPCQCTLDLIESFVDENPAHLSDDELDIVRSWRHLVHGKFYVFRELKKYTVFLSTDQPSHRLRRPGPVATVRGLDRPLPAGPDADGPAAVQGHDRLRRLDEQLQHFLRPRHPALV